MEKKGKNWQKNELENIETLVSLKMGTNSLLEEIFIIIERLKKVENPDLFKKGRVKELTNECLLSVEVAIEHLKNLKEVLHSLSDLKPSYAAKKNTRDS